MSIHLFAYTCPFCKVASLVGDSLFWQPATLSFYCSLAFMVCTLWLIKFSLSLSFVEDATDSCKTFVRSIKIVTFDVLAAKKYWHLPEYCAWFVYKNGILDLKNPTHVVRRRQSQVKVCCWDCCMLLHCEVTSTCRFTTPHCTCRRRPSMTTCTANSWSTLAVSWTITGSCLIQLYFYAAYSFLFNFACWRGLALTVDI